MTQTRRAGSDRAPKSQLQRSEAARPHPWKAGAGAAVSAPEPRSVERAGRGQAPDVCGLAHRERHRKPRISLNQAYVKAMPGHQLQLSGNSI